MCISFAQKKDQESLQKFLFSSFQSPEQIRRNRLLVFLWVGFKKYQEPISRVGKVNL